MFKLIKRITDTFGIRKLQELEAINDLDGQRPESITHIQGIAEEMRQEAFRPADFSIAVLTYEKGRHVLVNGQHTVKAGIIVGKPLYGSITWYECKTPHDLMRLYSTFDDHRKRTIRDRHRASRPLYKDKALRSMSIDVLNCAGAALVALGGGTKPNFLAKPSNKAEPAFLIERYMHDVMYVSSYIQKHTKKIVSQSVATAIIATHRVDLDHAPDFWERVIFGDRLERGTPQYELRNKLLDPKQIYRNLTNSYQKKAAIYNYCICWWNSYATGEQRNSVKIAAIEGIVNVKPVTMLKAG